MRNGNAMTGVQGNVIHALGVAEQEPKRASAPNGTKMLPQTPAPLLCERRSAKVIPTAIEFALGNTLATYLNYHSCYLKQGHGYLVWVKYERKIKYLVSFWNHHPLGHN